MYVLTGFVSVKHFQDCAFIQDFGADFLQSQSSLNPFKAECNFPFLSIVDQSISVLKVVRLYFSFLSKF